MSSAIDYVRYSCGIAGEDVANYVDELEKRTSADTDLIEQLEARNAEPTTANEFDKLHIQALQRENAGLTEENATLHEQVDLQIPKLAFEQLTAEVEEQRSDHMKLVEENHELRAQLAKAEQRVAEYNELLYAVQTKHPDETRHQTALRYIRNAENRPSNTAANGASS